MQDTIYVRNDLQCLFAYVGGETYEVTKDPLLPETYRSIVLNNELVHFHDLASDRILVNDPIGMAIYQSRMNGIRLAEAEAHRCDRCQIHIDFFRLLLANFDPQKEYTDEPLYVKGEQIVNILTSAGYQDVEYYFDFEIDMDKMYFIHPDYIHHDIVNLLPDCVRDIVADSTEPFIVTH